METTKPTHPLLHKISYYAVLAALVLIFASSAWMKLSDAETVVNNFSKWDLLDWKDTIAWIEILGVITLAIPRTSLFGSLILSVIMCGAIYTHLRFEEPMYFPLAILLVIWINQLFIKPKKA